MAESDLAALAAQLPSLDLAILSCLIAKQHCLIEAEPEDLDNVEQELKLVIYITPNIHHGKLIDLKVARELFGLPSASVSCHPGTTLEDFSDGILLAIDNEEDPKAFAGNTQQKTSTSYSIPNPTSAQKHSIANIIIAKNLSNATRQIQIQVLELIRTNRILTHTSMHTTPKPFLLIILNTTIAEKINIHLSDNILLSHYHDLEEGLPHQKTPQTSPSSLIPLNPIFSPVEIQRLHSVLPLITLTTEVRSYLTSLAVTIRTHRFVKPGSASPTSTRDLETLSRCLALLHGLEYVSPSLVALAARRVYRHRIRVLRPDEAGWERSIMYGSSEVAIRGMLERLWTTEDGEMKDEIEVADGILEQVISLVEIPV